MNLTIQTKDGPMDAYVAKPRGGGPAPAVIVVQEAFGVTPHFTDLCERFAREGYIAVAPEFFHRSGRGLVFGSDDFEKVKPVFSKVTNETLETDLKATISALGEMSDVIPGAIGVVGFCMGGFASFLAACRASIRAAVCFYAGGLVESRPGIGLSPLIGEAGKIKAPILCFFGDADKSIPTAQISAVRTALEDARVKHEVIVYPGAQHAFFNNDRPNYDEASAKDAWPRTLAWFGQALRPGLHKT